MTARPQAAQFAQGHKQGPVVAVADDLGGYGLTSLQRGDSHREPMEERGQEPSTTRPTMRCTLPYTRMGEKLLSRGES
jgi:hypothetical protein